MISKCNHSENPCVHENFIQIVSNCVASAQLTNNLLPMKLMPLLFHGNNGASVNIVNMDSFTANNLHFFFTSRDELPGNVLSSMQTIMEVILEESEDVPENLLVTLLTVLGDDRKVWICFLSCPLSILFINFSSFLL